MPFEIHRTLVLSTAHLTAETCTLLTDTPLSGWPVAGGQTGYGFYIYAHDEIGDEVPSDLAACLTFARSVAGCEYVHFDSDGDPLDALPAFDHGGAPLWVAAPLSVAPQ